MAINCGPVSGTGSGSGGSGCQNPCNCTFFDDGVVRVGDAYVLDSGKGRRNTVVSGEGTVEDPYTVSFIDSEFYRPDAGEYTYPNQDAVVEDHLVGFFPADGVVVYQTPSVVFGGLSEDVNPLIANRIAKGFFQVFGASATFSASTTGTRKIYIHDNHTEQNILASNTVDAGSENQTLSCTGFHPGVFTTFGNSTPGYPTYIVRVFQSSGGTLPLTNLKFWMGSL